MAKISRGTSSFSWQKKHRIPKKCKSQVTILPTVPTSNPPTSTCKFSAKFVFNWTDSSKNRRKNRSKKLVKYSYDWFYMCADLWSLFDLRWSVPHFDQFFFFTAFESNKFQGNSKAKLLSAKMWNHLIKSSIFLREKESFAEHQNALPTLWAFSLSWHQFTLGTSLLPQSFHRVACNIFSASFFIGNICLQHYFLIGKMNISWKTTEYEFSKKPQMSACKNIHWREGLLKFSLLLVGGRQQKRWDSAVFSSTKILIFHIHVKINLRYLV